MQQMSDTSNISFPSSPIRVNAETNSKNYYQHQPPLKKKNKRGAKLRVGEIVRATIGDRIDSEFAFVQIPTGTFKAKITQNLRRNDSLLFKVIESNPQLILKVYEVSTGAKNNSTDPLELLRMLDVVDDNFHLNLINKLIEKRNSIRRDDLLELVKTCTLVDEHSSHDIRQEEVFDLIIEMQDGKLPLSINLIKKLLPLYVSEDKISEGLNLIFDFVNQDKSNKYQKLSELFADIEQNSYRKNNIFKMSLGDSDSFYSEIKALLSSSDVEQKRLRESLHLISDLIPSLGLWNIISFTRKIPLQYFIPYFFEGDYYIIRVKQRLIASGKDDPVSFYFSMPYGSSGQVRARVSAFQNQLKVYLVAANDKILNALSEYQSELKESLDQENVGVLEFQLSLDEIRDELSDINTTHSGDHFTIVV